MSSLSNQKQEQVKILELIVKLTEEVQKNVQDKHHFVASGKEYAQQVKKQKRVDENGMSEADERDFMNRFGELDKLLKFATEAHRSATYAYAIAKSVYGPKPGSSDGIYGLIAATSAFIGIQKRHEMIPESHLAWVESCRLVVTTYSPK
jgi:hypothetical protein